MDLDSTHNIFKDKVPRAKEEMEEKLHVRMYTCVCLCVCVCDVELSRGLHNGMYMHMCAV